MANEGIGIQETKVETQMVSTVDKKSIAGDMVIIEGNDQATVLQNASSVGVFMFVGKFKHIVGTCEADQDGSLVIHQSANGYDTHYSTTIATNSGVVDAFDVEIVLPFVKVVWTEGNVGAATLDLFAYAKMV